MSIAKDVNEKLDEILAIRREIKRMDHDLDDDVQLKNMKTGESSSKEDALLVVEEMVDQIKLELSHLTNNGENIKDIFTNTFYVNDLMQDKACAKEEINQKLNNSAPNNLQNN